MTGDDGTVTAVSVTADSLAVNGGTIRDAAGRDADLGHPGIGDAAAEPEPVAAAESAPALDPDVLTARFSKLPAAHGGPGSEAFTFELAFSEALQLSYLTLRDRSLAATGGAVRKAQRLQQGSNIG